MRRPFERLVSLYFSPHRWFRRRFGSFRLPANVQFVEEYFLKLANNRRACWESITASPGKYVPPADLVVLKTETLANDLLKYFPELSKSVSQKNVSPFKDQAKKVLGSSDLRSQIESVDKHALDLDYFY